MSVYLRNFLTVYQETRLDSSDGFLSFFCARSQKMSGATWGI